MKNILCGLAAIALSFALNAQSGLSKKEIKVIQKTHEISLLAVKIGELAPSHALTAETKAAARRMVEDYTLIREQAEGLASKKALSLSPDMPEKSAKILAWYEGKQGKDFDKAYLKGATKVNKGGICHVRKVYKRTDDSEVKDWSGKLLSTLEAHKTLLKQTCESVKKSK